MAEAKYFRMTCYDAPAKVTLATIGNSPAAVTLNYRLNGGDWGNFDNDAGVDLNPGDYVEFKGTNTRIGKDEGNYKTFTVTGEGKIKLAGDITTLLDPAGKTQLTTAQNYCFERLFKDQKNIVDAGDMSIIFEGAASRCCYYMFSGSGITRAPYVASQSAAYAMIAYMLHSCRNLRYVRFGGPSTILGGTVSLSWMASVPSEGIFVVEDPNFNMSIARTASSIPAGWTLLMAGTGSELYLNGSKTPTLALNGLYVKTLFINGKKVLWEGELPPPSFKIQNKGSAATHPLDTGIIEVLATEGVTCDIETSDA